MTEDKINEDKIPLLIIVVLGVSLFFLFKGCETINQADDNFIDNLTSSINNSNNTSVGTGDEVVVVEEVLPEFNECDSNNYEFPSFEDTIREGEGCVNEEDCRLYPPENYIGTIVIQTGYSEPLLQCCIEDGSCYWGG